MRPGVPWSVKGIDDQARQAAKQAARAAGLTLGQWLNSVILETADGPPGAGSPHNVVGNMKSASVASGVQTTRPSDNEIKDKLDKLADQLSSLTQQSQDTAVSRFIKPADHAGAEVGSLEAIIDRIETNERRSDAAFEVVNQRIEEMDEKLAGNTAAAFPDRPEDVPGFTALELAIRNIVDHVEISERRTVETLTAIQQRMADIASRATAAQDEDITASAPAIASLEQRISELTDRLEESSSGSSQSLKDYLDSQVDQLSQRIDAVHHSADAVTEKARSTAVEAVQEYSRGIEGQLEDIIEKLQSSSSVAPDTSHLQGEIESLNQRFDDIKTEAASERDVQALRTAIEQLTSQISTSPDLSPVTDFEQRFAELTERLEQNSGEDGVSPQLSDLDQRVQDLDARLQELMTGPQTGDSGNDVLVDQIASVADRLTATEQKLGHLDTIERSVAQLFESVEKNRMWAQEAAEEAAKQAVSHSLSGEPAGDQFAPSNELQALKDGLSAVKASAEISDQRNQETLGAVHDTLEQIIEKLTDLEQQDTAAPNVTDIADQAPTFAAEVQPSDPSHADITDPPATAQSAAADPDDVADLDPFDTQFQPASVIHAPSVPEGLSDPDFTAPQATTLADEPSAPLSSESQPPSEPQQDTLPDSGREDFIAAARRAAQSAAPQSIGTRMSGLSLTPKRGENDTDEGEEKSGSKFSLPFLRRSKSTQDSDEDVSAAVFNSIDSQADEAGVNGKRRQLILAGLILLAAVSAYSIGGIGKKSILPRLAPGKTSALEQPTKMSLQSSPQTVQPGSVIRKQSDKSATTGMSMADALVKPAGSPAQEYQSKQIGGDLHTASVPSSGTAQAKAARRTYAVQNVPAVPSHDRSKQASPSASTAPGVIGVTTLTKATPVPTPVMLPEQIGSASLRQAAIAGDANAQFVIASRYLEGKVVEADFKQAAEWYRKAAAHGLAPAQYRLGTMFERGRGLPKDLTAARLWYERAAERNNVKAMHNLAVIYANNQAGTAQFEKAAKWFRAAAEHGLRDSLYNLAVLYERGLGQAKDLLKAYFWFGVAAKHEDADARAKINSMMALVSAADRAGLDKEIAAWTPNRPDRAGNMVTITDPTWQVVSPPATKPPPKQTSDGQLILRAQQLLSDIGFDVGPKDGVMGSRTANAVRLFQLQSGMPVNGTVSTELISLLESRRG